jgi:hypothetical protein
VRRAQLYYLRGRVGRAARIRERRRVAKGAVDTAVVETLEQAEVTDSATQE